MTPPPVTTATTAVHSGRRLKVTVLRVAVVLAVVLIIAYVFDGVALFFPPCPNKLRCDTDWELNEGKCYYFSTFTLSWIRSKQRCESVSGRLVKIDSRLEQSFLFWRLGSLMREHEDKFWIGLTDSDTEGEWKWTDGSSLNHTATFWFNDATRYTREPDNWTGQNNQHPEGEDCVRMGEKENWSVNCWFDKHCDTRQRFICEKKPAHSQSHTEGDPCLMNVSSLVPTLLSASQNQSNSFLFPFNYKQQSQSHQIHPPYKKWYGPVEHTALHTRLTNIFAVRKLQWFHSVLHLGPQMMQ
ncbi:hypothetical protein WMY93_020240 [Mugilogobius chulae]|uniref:C-type lectin domain-containing protein n=1 Tax=Mugilogobius chulae TaxID=88201 RepID=A0AAW0NSH8_9GOBI